MRRTDRNCTSLVGKTYNAHRMDDARILKPMLRLIRAGFVGVELVIGASAALAFEGIVVFGDSLSDSGNAGRFSDGPNWVEQLGERLKIPVRPSQAGGTNFALGGARLDAASGANSLRAQADRDLRSAKPAGRNLYVVYGGGNDVLGAIGVATARSAVERGVSSLKSIISDLARHGATDILVPNLPDVGITPAVRARGDGALAQARALTHEFNAAVDEALRAFVGSRTLRIFHLDVYAMGERVRTDPTAFGFSNITIGCADIASCEGHLFWDNVHPTTRAHAHLADTAFRVVSPP
jgi:phospholipase/lecithinase/hemolysin